MVYLMTGERESYSIFAAKSRKKRERERRERERERRESDLALLQTMI